MSSAPAFSARLGRLARLLVAVAALLAPAAWNGVPLLYPDTPTYLRGAEAALMRLAGPGRLEPWVPAATASLPASGESEAAARAPGLNSLGDQIVLAGRSVYYGALLEAAHRAGSLWWAAAVQALCVAWLLYLLLVDAWRLPVRSYLPITVGLAWLTPLGLYTGLLMPDVFAGLAVLAVAALVAHGGQLRTGQRAGLVLLLLFALAAHVSHVAVVAALLFLALAGWWRARRRAVPAPGPWVPGLAMVAACLVMAGGAELAFARAVERAVGAPPLRLPHLTARLVDRGPGTDYLREACPRLAPESRWAACAFVDRYPVAWTDFLFATEPARGVFALADAPTKRRLSSEQVALAWQVLRREPVRVGAGIATDMLAQLVTFRLDIWGLGPRELAMYQGRVPPALFEDLRQSRGATWPQAQQLGSMVTMASVAASVGVLAWLAIRRRSAQPQGPQAVRARRAAGLVLAGLVANAFVCAALAAPLDRFQARLVWLLPLVAAARVVTALHDRRRQAAGDPPQAHWAGARPPQGSPP